MWHVTSNASVLAKRVSWICSCGFDTTEGKTTKSVFMLSGTKMWLVVTALSGKMMPR
jgi:hypothetical protein